jgi:uncharacterized protein YciW
MIKYATRLKLKKIGVQAGYCITLVLMVEFLSFEFNVIALLIYMIYKKEHE